MMMMVMTMVMMMIMMMIMIPDHGNHDVYFLVVMTIGHHDHG